MNPRNWYRACGLAAGAGALLSLIDALTGPSFGGQYVAAVLLLGALVVAYVVHATP